MSESNVRIRVKIGENEAEIEAPASTIKETIELIPEIARRIPQGVIEEGRLDKMQPALSSLVKPLAKETIRSQVPEIAVEKGDSLTSLLSKLFRDEWGRKPRKLIAVREVLDSYGLVYPKQSVAVALMRLAQSGKVRRFKDESSEFVYTTSFGLAGPSLQLRTVQQDLTPTSQS